MTPERWRQVKEIFLATIECPLDERPPYLAESCAGDAELRHEVERLLKADERAVSFIERSAFEIGAEHLHAWLDGSPEGQRVGRYELVREIGRGGMGAVYLARRADQEFDQLVAVKLVKRGMDTDAILRRFRVERQILANLRHPNIAALIDGGTSDDGRPFLVMEYIEGVPLTEYASAHGRSTHERLKLFRAICAGVTYAHQNLVIHRDLKPSNILITTDGTPKLLDFGIAKLLQTDVGEQGLTVTEFLALTPEYASPEQVRGGISVTTTSDVYSLGVILYELLTGARPYNLTGRTAEQIGRAVCEQEPERPSRAKAEGEERGAKLKGLWQYRTRHQQSLRGDLDNIVLMAMRKEPGRRYASVEQFSEDIRRYLEGLPVLARQDTVAYRAAKFVRRNKAGVAAGILVLLSLITGMALALTQARRATGQALAAAEQRDAAQRARARAEKTSRFMQGFLSYANPHWYGRGGGRTNITVREAMDDAATRIDTELADEPEVRADLHYTVGEIYRVSGEDERALRHFRQSLDLYRRVYGEQHPKVARGLYYLSIALARGGTDTSAESQLLLQQGIAIMRQTDPNNINLPYMLQSLAGWIMFDEERSGNESRLVEAEKLILEAKNLFTRHYGENHVATLTADSNLATLALTRGDLALAESLTEENLKRFRQVEEGSYNYIWSLTSLAKIKLALDRKKEAEMLYGQALELGRRQWGAKDVRFEQLLRTISEARRSR